MITPVSVLLATLLLGQFVSLILFVTIYLWFWGKYHWWIIGVYSLLSVIGLYGLFQPVVPVIWYPSPFFALF
jgi:hypothetical protein